MTPAQAQAAAWRILGTDAVRQALTLRHAAGGDPAVMRAVAEGLRETASELVALVPKEPPVDYCAGRVALHRSAGGSRHSERSPMGVACPVCGADDGAPCDEVAP